MSETETIEEEQSNKSFNIKSDNPKVLKTIVETLAHIIDESEIEVSPDALVIKAMDPSRICLFKLSLGKDCFDTYECSQKTTIGINLDAFDKVLKRSTSKDLITLVYDSSETIIKIQMKQEEKTRARNFTLGLISLDVEEVPTENLETIEYNSAWSMSPDFLVEAIKDAEIYSEILNMKTREETGLELSSIGTIGEMDYQLEPEDLIEPELENASGSYSIPFLKSILKIAGVAEQMRITLKEDHPLKIMFSLLEGGTLDFWLAPRVENENEEDYNDDMDDF